eukprot:Blabericola_migrator_1__6589@NODE_3321_length_1861_cov_6_722965_g2077_i0_p3_GENE_NODE_3321_length_1861_cov_6_722965_g2077_i0NODE_3321_length_1861_cov_6_722965_g2077_i0_p3_ORF_typecomplete_len145_score13_65_NODE_3321_length_1861_cov_6_722965_g2077_i096530
MANFQVLTSPRPPQLHTKALFDGVPNPLAALLEVLVARGRHVDEVMGPPWLPARVSSIPHGIPAPFSSQLNNKRTYPRILQLVPSWQSLGIDEDFISRLELDIPPVPICIDLLLLLRCQDVLSCLPEGFTPQFERSLACFQSCW